MTTTLLTILVTVLVLTGTATAALPHRPAWLPRFWFAVSLCETGGNWHHATRDYVSAFGIYRGAWHDYRPAWVPARPEDATPREQYAVALAIAAHGTGGWGCVSHGGYRYWLPRIR